MEKPLATFQEPGCSISNGSYLGSKYSLSHITAFKKESAPLKPSDNTGIRVYGNGGWFGSESYVDITFPFAVRVDWMREQINKDSEMTHKDCKVWEEVINKIITIKRPDSRYIHKRRTSATGFESAVWSDIFLNGYEESGRMPMQDKEYLKNLKQKNLKLSVNASSRRTFSRRRSSTTDSRW